MDVLSHQGRLAAGFTLIELMVSVSVVAILLTVGVPSFNRFIEHTLITKTSHEVRSGLALARTEAVKRNSPVQLCNLDTQTNSCAGLAAVGRTVWTAGFLVFRDLNNNRLYEPQQDLLLREVVFDDAVTVSWGRGDLLIYASTGRPQLGNSSFNILHTQSQQGRRLVLNNSGRVRAEPL